MRAASLTLPALLLPLFWAAAAEADADAGPEAAAETDAGTAAETDAGTTPGTEAAPTAPADAGPPSALDAELAELAAASAGEVIEVYSERPDKPFDRDTRLRLTEEIFERRVVSNLADAIDLLPDVTARDAGRGGRQIDIRGARKGSVQILVDGVPIADPFYGNIDVDSIPVTDIVQIRVSKSPASPIDGIGGPGGVVEIHTRDAIGGRLFAAHVQGKSQPSLLTAVSGRTPLAAHLALRGSATVTLGWEDFKVARAGADPIALPEDRRQFAAGARVEYRRGEQRIAVDLYGQHQELVVPPGEDGTSDILVLRGEQRARLSFLADDHYGAWLAQARGYFAAIRRDSAFYSDPDLTQFERAEDLLATRAGLFLLGSRALGKAWRVVGSTAIDSEHADVDGFDGAKVNARVSTLQAAAGAQFEEGRWKLDGAAGVAVPLGLEGANPWPEFKLTTTFFPIGPVTLKAIAGRKGRVPTLRDRFAFQSGNESLGPEQVLYGEFEVELRPLAWFAITSAAFDRESNGIIRRDPSNGLLTNLGKASIRGAEIRIDLGEEGGRLRGGGSGTFTDAYSRELGTDSLDFLPRYKVEGWIEGRAQRGFGGIARVRWNDTQIDQATELPRQTRAELSAYAPLGDVFTASARADVNLLRGAELDIGEDYQSRANIFTPGLVFTLSVSAEWK